MKVLVMQRLIQQFLSTRVLIHSGKRARASGPLEKKLVFSIIGFKQCCGNRLDSQNLVEGQENCREGGRKVYMMGK